MAICDMTEIILIIYEVQMQSRMKNAKNSPFSHCPSYNIGIVFNFSWDDYDKAFSLTWLVSMQNYWNKRKRSTTTELVWNSNMAAVTSCVNALNNVMQISFFQGGGGRGGEGVRER